MEDIEYLEEYEDLVLPALNSAASEAAASSASFETNKNLIQKKIDEADDSSSSLDQDIFNCLFDDNSDDDYNEYRNSDIELALNSKPTSNDKFLTLDDKFEKIDNPVIEKLEISRQDSSTKHNITSKAVHKNTSATKPKSFMTKTSGTTIPLSTIKPQTSENKTKSVATVRPTVQNQLTTNLSKKTNIPQIPSPSPSTSSLKRQSASTSNTYRTIRFPVVQPKSSSSLSATSSSSASNLINKKPPISSFTTVKSSIKRSPTIVRPEKIITTDPVNDPLDLDELSQTDSEYSYSDISGESYYSGSNFEDEHISDDEFYSGEDDEYLDDEDYVDDLSSSSQIIELSNDSSGAPSKFEDKRAPTPSPVISDDSNTSSNSAGFILSRKQAIKPYSHPGIIESVLRKAEKPKLLELLQTYNLLDDSVENIEEDSTAIDIKTFSDNFVENTNTHQQVSNCQQSSPLTTIIIDPVDSTDKKNSLTLNTADKKQSNNSKKTNKKKTKKKSLTNMDAGNDYSTDSDLSAVEELLEESYAEAMKKVQTVTHTDQEMMGAEMVINEVEDVIVIKENEQNQPTIDIVSDSDEKNKACKEHKTDKTPENTLEEKERINKDDNNLNKESIKLLESDTTEQEIYEESKTEIVKNEIDNANDLPLLTVNNECKEIEEVLVKDKSIATDSQNTKKKKRFRNLITPEPNEMSSEEAKSMDDIKDFKGFEDVASLSENVEEIKIQNTSQTAKVCTETPTDPSKISEKILTPESFKSPAQSSHQSVKDKLKEHSSSKHSKSKSIVTLKDGSSRESSRDKSSRENSKDRSRESSKDRLKHSSRDKEHSSKHHHSDHRRSRDSKDSSKSRESSKCRDTKESRDSSKSSSSKKDQVLDSNREKSKDKNYTKSSKETEKHSKTDTEKSKNETKSSHKDNAKKNISKEHNKSSAEKSDKKSSESTQNILTKANQISKTPKTNVQESKQIKDSRKSSTSSDFSGGSDSSKDRNISNKTQNTTKICNATEKTEKAKITSTPTKIVKVKKITEKTDLSKSSTETVNKDKVVQTTNDNNKNLKDTTGKQIVQNPKTSESSSKDSSKTTNQPSSVLKKTNNEEVQFKKTSNGGANNKTSSEKKELDKTPNKSNTLSKTKIKTPIKQQDKETVSLGSSTKHTEGTSSKKSSNSNSTAFMKTNETCSDFKKPKDTTKETKELDTKCVSMSPKIDLASKEEGIKKPDLSKDKIIKKTEVNEHKRLEDSKTLDTTAIQKPKEKKSDNNIKDSKTIEPKITLEKSLSNADTNLVKKTESKVIKANKNESKKEQLGKTQNISEKQTVVKKDESKDEVLNSEKTNIIPTNKNTSASQKNAQALNKRTQSPGSSKKPTANKDATNEAQVRSLKTTQNESDKTEVNIAKTPQTKKKFKELKTATIEANNPNDQTKTKTTDLPSSINKDKIKENVTTVKSLAASPKPLKKPQIGVSSTKTLKTTQTAVSKTITEVIKTTPKILETSQVAKTVDIANTEGTKKIHSTIKETKSNSNAGLEINKKKDLEFGDDKEKEIQIENLDAETKESQADVKQLIVSKTEDVITHTPNDNEEEMHSLNISLKTKSLMKTVLKKSVVILIEPLKSIHHHHLAKDNQNEFETKPRKTRSCNENKLNDSGITLSSDDKKVNGSGKNKGQEQIKQNDDLKKNTIKSETEVEYATSKFEGKTKQKSDIKTDTKISTEKIDLTTPEKTASYEENCSKQQDSKRIKITQTVQNSQAEAKKSVSESTNPPHLMRQKTDIRTEKNNFKAEINANSEIEEYNLNIINIQEKSYLKTESKEINLQQIQTNKNIDLKSKAVNISKSENKDTTEDHNLDTKKVRQRTDSKEESISKEIYDETPLFKESSSEQIPKRKTADLKTQANNSLVKENKKVSVEKIECEDSNLEPIKTRQKTDAKTELKKSNTKDEETTVRKTKVEEEELKPIKTRQKSDLKTESKNSKTVYSESSHKKSDLKSQQNVLDPPTKSTIREKITSDEKTEGKEMNSEPIKTKEKEELKSLATKSDIKDNKEKSDKRNEGEESKVDSVTSRQRTVLDTEGGKSETNDTKEKSTKIRQKADSKTQASKSKTKNDKGISEEKIDCEERDFVPIKTRQKTDLESDANKSKVQEETPTKNKQRPASKTQEIKSEIKDNKLNSDKKNEGEESRVESVKSQQNIVLETVGGNSETNDTKEISNKIRQKADSKTQESKYEMKDNKENSSKKVVCEESGFVPIKTRQRADLEADENKSEIKDTEENAIENKKRSDSKTLEIKSDIKGNLEKSFKKNEGEESRVDSVKTRQRTILDTEGGKSETNDTKEKSTKIRPKADLKTQESKSKTKNDKENSGDKIECEESDFVPIKTRQKKDLEADANKSKVQEETPTKNKQRPASKTQEIKPEMKDNKENSDSKNEGEESKVESVKSRQNIVLETVGEKSETNDTKENTIKIRQNADSKTHESKFEMMDNKENSDKKIECEECHFEPIKTRKKEDLKADSNKSEVKDTEETPVEIMKSPDTKTLEIKSEIKDNKEKSDKKNEAEESRVDSNKTRQRTVLDTEGGKSETNDTKEKSTKIRQKADLKTQESKSITKNDKENSGDRIECEESDFVPMKTRQKTDLEADANKSKVQEETPTKNKQRPASKTQEIKSEITDDKFKSVEKIDCKEDHLHPIKTRQKTDSKKSGADDTKEKQTKEKPDSKMQEKEKLDYEENSLNSIKSSPKVNLQNETINKKDECDKKSECEVVFEPMKSKKNEDIKLDTNYTDTVGLLTENEKSAEETAENSEEKIEKRRTRNRGEQKVELQTGRKSVSHKEGSIIQTSVEIQGKYSKKSQRITLNLDDKKSSNKKKYKEDVGENDCNISSILSVEETKPEKFVTEVAKTTRIHHQKKEDQSKNKKVETELLVEQNTVQNDLNESLEPIRTRSRVDIKIKNYQRISEVSQEPREEDKETIQTKSVSDEVAEEKGLNDVDAFEPIKARLQNDNKVEGVNKKNPVLQAEKLVEKEDLTTSRTRKTGNVKELKIEMELEKNVIDLFASTTTVICTDTTSDGEKGTNVINKLSKEKSMVLEDTEKPCLEPRITRSRVEHKTLTDNKTITKNPAEPTKTKGVVNVEVSSEKETKQMSQEHFKTDKQLLESNKDIKQKILPESVENKSITLQNNKIISAVDKKFVEAINSEVPKGEDKQEEISERNTSLRIIAEIDKIFQENSENDMSGFESSSSSNTENCNKRSLRKRKTDSPFAENDKNKKQFKEPPQKAITHSTPKTTKSEKEIAVASSGSFKRTLRSPALDADIQPLSKKIKLDPTKKSTPYSNLQDEGQLVIAGVIAKEQSSSNVCKIDQKVNIKEIKDNSRNTVLSDKKLKEKVRDKTSPTSVAVLPEQKLDNETVIKSNKEDGSLKSVVSSVLKGTNTDIENLSEATVQSKTIKTKHKTTPNKSPGSGSVLSFSDWLKKKSTNIPAECAKTNEDIGTPENLKRQSRVRSRLPPQSKEDIEKAVEAPRAPEVDNTMVIHDNENVLALEQSQEVPKISDVNQSKTLENMDTTKQLHNILLQPSENRLHSANKEHNDKKTNVKSLQTSNSKKKKSETLMLIESMSKEMKEGGVTDLLKTEIPVKRQRVPNTRNKSASIFTTTPTRETRSLSASLVQLTNLEHDKSLEHKSEGGNISPIRRKALQNVAKSRKYTTLTDNDTTITYGNNIPHKNPKSPTTLSIKDLHTEIENKTLPTTTDVLKIRKSMPLLPSESLPLAKCNNLSSRKSLANLREQQIDKHKNIIFKMPKKTGQSNLLNKIPTLNAENLNKLYADERKQLDSRIKIHQTEKNLLKKFKCRKLIVRLDRTIVQQFLVSPSNRGKQTLPRKETVLKNAPSTADILPIIQNNSETNLRIQSVVDASAIFNRSTSAAAMKDTQDTQPIVVPSTANMQNFRGISVQAPAQSFQSTVPSATSSVEIPQTVSLLNECFELKNEFMDENPIGSLNEEILPDTPTLLARAQTITEAAQQALSKSVTPTDIRLLTTDSSESSFVPSFGVTPTALDNRGTSMYTFLHPAKYNRNHSNVLLDYCCPNLNGPMPAIDPTRIHSQVQVPIIELPSSIVLTTKWVTRADLESGDTSIPAIIRKKAEKIRKNMATHHKMAVSAANSLAQASTASRPALPATINALTKQLPATTTITARLRPPIMQQPQMPTPLPSIAQSLEPTLSVIPKGQMLQLNAVQQSSLRSNLRRFDGLLKQLLQPYESLSFVERHRIIEAVIATGKCLPKDIEQTLVVMEEYIKQTMMLKDELHKQPTTSSAPAITSTKNYTASQPAVGSLLSSAQMPQLQPSPKILASKVVPAAANSYSSQFEQSINKSGRKVQSRGKNVTSGTSDAATMKHCQVPIYDTDRNIIGYQMQIMAPMSTMPASAKSTMPSHSSIIMSTSSDPEITAYKIAKRPLKRPAQDSPRVFYTTPPMKTSTPKAVTSSNIYPNQNTQVANTTAQKSKGSIITTIRSAGSSSSPGSEAITTTTMATVKRVTRSTATGSKIIIVSKSNQSSDETILPDSNQDQAEHTEIKHEKDIDDFLG